MRARALGVLLAVACDAPPPRTSSPRAASSQPLVLAAVAAVDPIALAAPALLPLPSPPPAPAWRDASGALTLPEHWLPGPARSKDPPRDPAARFTSDQACRRCHAGAAHEWAGSQHAGSWNGQAFVRAFAAEPRAFCQRCHAPEEDAHTATGEVTEAAASLGVGCVTCHVQPGTVEVWAAPRLPAVDALDRDARAPHPIARSPAFGGPQACARCHEFSFPDPHALRDHPLAMQSTIAEHGRSPAADRSCADCHMPHDDDGRRSHAFAGAYDRTMLAGALEIEVTRPEPTHVHVRLAPGRVGHAVPTGDLLRRLAVRVYVEDSSGATVFAATRYYGRRFAEVHQHGGIALRGELSDDRIGMGPEGGVREASFAVPTTLTHAPVRWEVIHQRVAAGSREARSAPIEGELLIANGTLQP